MAISFKGAQYPKSVILFAVFFYVHYAVSYRDLEEVMAERGVTVDHATLNRWVVRYAVVSRMLWKFPGGWLRAYESFTVQAARSSGIG
jgi:transposase-like protein